jgi:hypothetical protein
MQRFRETILYRSGVGALINQRNIRTWQKRLLQTAAYQYSTDLTTGIINDGLMKFAFVKSMIYYCGKNLKMNYIKRYSTLLLCLVALGACSKKSNSVDYTVSGLTDITVEQYQDTNVVVGVAVGLITGSSTQDNITLTPANLPSGVTVSPASIGGLVPFANYFTFHVNADSTGTYPIEIVGTTASGNKRTFNFNLVVGTNPDCSHELTNSQTWKSVLTTASSSGTTVDSGNAIVNSFSSNTVDINTSPSNYIGATAQFTGYLTCNTGAIITGLISARTSSAGTGGLQFFDGEQTGTASFSSNKISLSYSGENYSTGVTYNCTLLLYR